MNNASEEEKAEHASLSRAQKGFMAALHMVKNSVPKFFHTAMAHMETQSLDKREKWQSELQMLEQFGEEEFAQRLQSGRIEWRADPWTYGVYNYKDLGDVVRRTTVQRKREWTAGQEYQGNEQDEAEWGNRFSKDLHTQLQDAEHYGKGKGKLSLLKGKGKGKGKGKLGNGKNNEVLALEDGELEEKEKEQPDEAKQWAEWLVKAKRARDQATIAETAMQQADLAKRLTKTSKKDAEQMLDGLSKTMKTLKDVLAKQDKAMKLEKAKALLVEMVGKTKEVNSETKVANKAGSKASTRK